MLRIRLQRVGRKHEPNFRIVLTDSHNSTKSGKFLEVLGSYDPRTNKPVLNGDRIKHWLSKGAKLTDTLHNLLITENVISGKKRNVLPQKSPPRKEELKAAKADPKTSEELAPQETKETKIDKESLAV